MPHLRRPSRLPTAPHRDRESDLLGSTSARKRRRRIADPRRKLNLSENDPGSNADEDQSRARDKVAIIKIGAQEEYAEKGEYVINDIMQRDQNSEGDGLKDDNDEDDNENASQEDDMGEDGSSEEQPDDEESIQLYKNKVNDDGDDATPHRTISLVSAPSRVPKKSPNLYTAKIPRPLSQKATASTPAAAPAKSAATFADLGLDSWLVRSLTNMAIRRPTGIQKACIPQILRGRDCIGGSRTGTGKTVAFAAPILQCWARDPSAVFAVVLTPTRELALQIYEQFRAIAAPYGSLRALLVTGGADMRPQAIELSRTPDLVIATPGRLADHIRTSGEDTVGGLRRARFVVLDEADRLLDPRASAGGRGSMLPDVDECLGALSPAHLRQNLLFTATVTPEVRALRDMPPRPGREPPFVCEVAVVAPFAALDLTTVSVEHADSGSDDNNGGGGRDIANGGVGVAPDALPASLDLRYVQVPVTHREHYLHVLLSTEANAARSAIVFCNRTTTADYLHHLLRLLEHRVTSLHSRLPQRQRTDNLARFRASAARVLVATDVAARGLDIPEVALVINYDVPRDPDDFVHRVGRTARAGRPGLALSLVGQRDVDCILAIETRVRRKMQPWAEDGVSLDSRVVRDALRPVSERKREALLELEEGRDVGGRRRRQKINLRFSV